MLCEQVRGHESFEEMVHVLAGTWMNSSPSNVCVHFSNKGACVQAAPRLTFSWLGLHVLHFFKRFHHRYLSQSQAKLLCSLPQNWKRREILQPTSPSFPQKSCWGCFTIWALKICVAAVKCAALGQSWPRPALCGGTSTLYTGPEVSCWELVIGTEK